MLNHKPFEKLLPKDLIEKILYHQFRAIELTKKLKYEKTISDNTKPPPPNK